MHPEFVPVTSQTSEQKKLHQQNLIGASVSSTLLEGLSSFEKKEVAVHWQQDASLDTTPKP
jgi:hypothetical protein